MRILIDARLYGLEHAGLGRYAINLVNELAKIDIENEYILLLRKKYYESLSLPKNFKKVLADFRHYGFKEQILLPKIIFKEKPDLTHFLHFNVPLAFKGKYIVTIHDLQMHKQKGVDTTTLPIYQYALKRAGYKVVFNKAVKKSLRIIVPSQFVKKELMGVYKISDEKVVVTYEGVDEFWAEKFADKDILARYNLPEKFFVYAGNAYPHKNLKRAVEAVSGVTGTVLAISCARSIFTQRLEKLVDEMHAQNKVKLLGFVPDEDLRVLYKKSVAFLYPSLMEGFGLPGLEAISAGTLVLASDISVFREVYKDNVIYFNPFDFTSIQKAIENALAISEARRKEIIKSAQEFISRYSWEKMAKETLQVYNEAL